MVGHGRWVFLLRSGLDRGAMLGPRSTVIRWWLGNDLWLGSAAELMSTQVASTMYVASEHV